MVRLAIIQFPGFNCEHETRRIVRAAGLEAVLVRWNDTDVRFEDFDGFVLPGGFSYEDRGRAGLIASLDPAMEKLIAAAEGGKPLLGICNGAQVLVETGLIPGAPDRNLLMSLARNKRVQNGRVLGTGFYNAWVHVKPSAAPGRTPFTLGLERDRVWKIPVAHGEGRFTTIHPDLPQELLDNDQVIFQYCDAAGGVSSEFPVNPNGALHNMAALSNPAGNVMGIMPHPERGFSAPMEALFNSLALWFNDRKPHSGLTLKSHSAPVLPSETYAPTSGSLEFLIDLLITDNEAESLQSALRRKGFSNVRLERAVHYEVLTQDGADLTTIERAVTASGELFNSNKERATVRTTDDVRPPALDGSFRILVRDREDFAGQGKAQALRHHLGEAAQLSAIKRGTLWTVHAPATDAAAILSTHIFHNPHAQTIQHY